MDEMEVDGHSPNRGASNDDDVIDPGEDYDHYRPPIKRRSLLYMQPPVKTCMFYQDGDYFTNGVKLAISKHRYHKIESLQDDLTGRMKSLPYGVRRISTPRGVHTIENISQLETDGRYICSSSSRSHGMDLATTPGMRPWLAGRAGNKINRYDRLPPLSPRKEPKRAWRDNNDPDRLYRSPYRSREPKKIVVINNDDQTDRQTLLLNPRARVTFDQVLQDLSENFQWTVKKLYTMTGRPVYGLQTILSGPEMYVATPGTHFKPISSSMSDPGMMSPRDRPVPKRKAYTGDRVHLQQQQKRDKLARTRGRWHVWVQTNELPSAGTQAQVTITVYGHKGNSGPIPLGSPKGGDFQAGSTDEFDVNAGHIGELYKIRIAHDNTGDFPGWFCDEVRMRDRDSNEELIFDCRRWLSRDEDDFEICRELPVVKLGRPIQPVVSYKVSAVTGDLWGAGTSANVYITLYGEKSKGDTGVRLLYSSQKPEKFLKGQVDVFTLEAVSLGDLKRCIIGHDGTSPGEGWFLEKIIVKEVTQAGIDWVFPCHQWLDDAEADGKLVRELKPDMEIPLSKHNNKLWKYEQWKFQKNNQILLYSKMTQRPMCIRSDASVDGKGDYNDPQGTFAVVERSDGSDQVKILQSVAHSKYHLAIDNSKILGQGRGGSYCQFYPLVTEDRSVMFESGKYNHQFLSVMQNGKPGDPRGSHSDPAKQFFVYCKGMFRDEGVIILCTSISQTLIATPNMALMATGRRNEVARFKVHKVAEKVRMFESIVFPGNFVRIKDGTADCKGTGDSYCHFRVERVREKGYVTLECEKNRGMYLGMTPDGKVRPTVDTGDKNVRFFPEVYQFGIPKQPDAPPVPVKPRKKKPTPREATPPPREATPPREETPPAREDSAKSVFDEGDWKLVLTTSESARDARIAIVVYGDKGNSGAIILGEAKKNGLFVKGNEDQFKANLKEVGLIYKVRLELHPTSPKKGPFWKPYQLKMKDMTTNEVLKFKFDRHMSRTHDDGDIQREMYAIRPGKKPLKVFTYQIYIYTGSEPGSDTDANVYLTLFGERGDTGKRQLLRSDQDVKFQEGQVDHFELEAVDLGKLKRAVVCHDGEGGGEGWYCQQIVVHESVDATEEYIFMCERWLDSTMDDGKIERVLKVKDDTDDDADIEEVEDEHRPVAQEKDETPPPEETPEPGDWMIWVTTGDESNMGTTNEVELYVYGEEGTVGPLSLGSGQDGKLFQPGQTDDIKVNLGTELGTLYKIRLGHTDGDPRSGWYITKVKMKDLNTEDVLTFKVNRWLWRYEEDCDVWRELSVVNPGQKPLPVIIYRVEVYTGTEPAADTEAEVYVQLFGSRGDSGKRVLYESQSNSNKFQEGQVDVFLLEAVDLDRVEKVIVGHNGKGKGEGWYLDHIMVKAGDQPDSPIFYFPCERWLDKGLDDGKTERELLAKPPPKQTRGEYKVWIKTHKDSTPANGSKVLMTAYGDKGRSKDMEVFASKPVFEAGNVDQFDLSFGDIGEPYKVRVSRMDTDTWADGGWHLNEVKMEDKDTGATYLLKFDCWLDFEKDGHDIAKERAKKKKVPTATLR